MPKRKRKSRRINLAAIASLLFVVGVAFAMAVYWAYQTEGSDLAKSIRALIDRVRPERLEVVEETVAHESIIENTAAPEPKPQLVPVSPPPVRSISMEEVSKQKYLWPKSLALIVSKRVTIRYNEKEYGFMEFSEGMTLKVDALTSNGEAIGWIDGNYLSLSVHETNFVRWFEETHNERYELEPVFFDDLERYSRVRFRLGTKKGNAEFWSEMHIWCHRNYGSVSLEVGEESLLFRWLPEEDVEINYEAEARVIARKYLTLRNKYGSSENFASCQIQNPITDEFLGSSSIFIPRF